MIVMQTSFQQLQQWTDLNNMQINFPKTKEMILGPLAKLSPQLLSCNSGSPPSTVERVQYFKLLGITVSSDLNWQKHNDTIISKAYSRIYFLRIFKKFWSSSAPLLCNCDQTSSRVLFGRLTSWPHQGPGWISRGHTASSTPHNLPSHIWLSLRRSS